MAFDYLLFLIGTEGNYEKVTWNDVVKMNSVSEPIVFFSDI